MTRGEKAALRIARAVKSVYDTDPWKNLGQRQAYYVALAALRDYEVIKDFNVVEGSITTLKGEKYV